MWNALYQTLYDEVKSLIKDDVYIKFYNETKPLHLKTEASGIGLCTTLSQTGDGITFPKDTPDNTILRPNALASISLTSVKQRYTNIKREALGILQGLERFCHYCFTRGVSIITNHKPLVAIFENDVATLSQRMQCILLRIHQFQVRILYKPQSEPFHCRLAAETQSCRE